MDVQDRVGQGGDIERYLDVIYRRCCRILNDQELAWDALQEVFTSFLETTRGRVIEEPLRYLYRSSTNNCLNLLRRQGRSLEIPTELFVISPERSVESKLMLEHLGEHLGEDALQLLIYRYLDQMTFGEIGAIYGRSDRAIKKRLDRLQQKILDYLNENEV